MAVITTAIIAAEILRFQTPFGKFSFLASGIFGRRGLFFLRNATLIVPSQHTRQTSTKSSPACPCTTSCPSSSPSPAAVSDGQHGTRISSQASTAAGVAVGSTVGHMLGNGISSLFGGSSSQPQQVAPPPAQQMQDNTQTQDMCAPDQRAFMKCLDSNQNDISACQFYLDV